MPYQPVHNLNDEAKNYINLAMSGFHPLVFTEWIYEAHQDTKSINQFKAKKVFYNTLKKLSKHKNPDRKKMALCNLPEKERKEFIKAWIKLAEVGTLESNSELH